MTTARPTTTFDTRPGAARRGRGCRPGFNFTEVLFAVMILGIGFIMVAAIFPVALQQARVTGDQTAAAQIARGLINQLEQIALMPPVTGVGNQPDTPLMDRTDDLTREQLGDLDIAPGQLVIVPGKVFSFRDDRFLDGNDGTYEDWQRDALWNAVKGNMILPSDTRYACVGLYRRDGWYTNNGGGVAGASPYVQVFVVAVQIRNRTSYEPAVDLRRFSNGVADDGPTNDSPPATLEPALITATLTNADDPDEADRIQVTGGLTQARGRMAPGAVLIISDDNLTGADYGTMNGRIYRVGNPVDDPATTDTWELAPGNDMAATDPDGLPNAQVFVIGRSLADPTQPFDAEDNPFEGGVQDIAVYTSFIYANQ